MTKFKDFGSPISSEGAELVVFKLYGEDFACRSQLPGKVMLDLASRTADEENAALSATVITDFFKYVLLPESLERFDKLCVDPDRIVTMEQLMDIVAWLMETYADRPTVRPEDSLSGQ